jgi:hypothetical protein
MTAIIGGYKGKSHVSLGKITVTAGGSGSIKIPQDIVVKEFILVCNGYMAATFAGSKPGVHPYGILHGIINEISLSRRGTDRVRSYQGTRQLLHTLERQFGQKEPVIYKVNSTDLSGTVVEGLPVWGTTGQNVAFRESHTIMMENKLSGAWYPTLFDTKGLQTATLNISFNQFASVQDPEDAAVASYTGSMEIEVFASCADYLLGSKDIGQADWNQTYEELEFSGVQTNARKYITPQGMLQGMLITGLHSGSKPFDFQNMKNTRLEVKYNGIQLAEGSLADFMEIDNVKTALNSRKKGSAYLSFLNNGAFDSGLFIAEGKQLELIVSTDSTLSYASPVKLRFEYDQITFAPAAPAQAKPA